MSKKTVRKLVRLNRVIADVSGLINQNQGIDMDFLEECAAAAWSHLWVEKLMSDDIHFTTVSNHLALMPMTWKKVHSVLYRKHLTQDEIDNLIEFINTTTTNIENQTVDVKNVIESKMSGSYLTDWKFMRAGHNIVSMSYMSEDSPIIGSNCVYSFDMVGEDCMRLSESDGYVIIRYKTPPKDKDGTYLVPDIAEIWEALTFYILWKIQLKLWLMGEVGAEGRYKELKRQWEIYQALAQGELMKINLAEYYGLLSTNKLFKNDPYEMIFTSSGYERINLTTF